MKTEVGGLWKVRTTLEKYHEDIAPFKGREHVFHELYTPYETIGKVGNSLLNEGINNMWSLICGDAGADAYNNANARLGVGDSDTAEAATQTDLQAATNKVYGAMEASFPTYGTSQKADRKSVV